MDKSYYSVSINFTNVTNGSISSLEYYPSKVGIAQRWRLRVYFYLNILFIPLDRTLILYRLYWMVHRELWGILSLHEVGLITYRGFWIFLISVTAWQTSQMKWFEWIWSLWPKFNFSDSSSNKIGFTKRLWSTNETIFLSRLTSNEKNKLSPNIVSCHHSYVTKLNPRVWTKR